MAAPAINTLPSMAKPASPSVDAARVASSRLFETGMRPPVCNRAKHLIDDRGIVYCLDAKTGAEVYGGKRIKPGTYSSSPTLADGKIYITSEDGVTSVLKTGPVFEVLAENNVNDYCLSTIAVSDGQLFLRTSQALWCIGKRH